MTYKKTWLSYLLWAVYTCLTGVMLANYSVLFWQKKINSAVNYGTVVFVLLIFAMVPGLYFLIRKLFGKIRGKYNISSHTKSLWEIFIVLSLFFAGLLYRVSLYLQNIGRITESSYYQLATVKTEDIAEPIIHGASYLYTMCLSFVLSFLGNKIDAAVWLQILLQMITILLAFFVVRRLAGRIPACITMLALAGSSVYAEQILTITPESLFFALYLVGMFIIGGYVKNDCESRAEKSLAVLGALSSGLTIGFLTYLDAISLTLFLPLFGLVTGVRTAESGKRRRKKASKHRNTGFSVLLIAAAFVAGALAFAGMLALNAFSYYVEIRPMAEAWFELYREHLAIDYVFYQTEFSVIGCFVLVFLAAFLILAFWNRRKVENASLWFVLMFLLAPTPLTAAGLLPYQVYSIFIWGTLAGIGIQQSFAWEKAVLIKTEVTEERPEEIVWEEITQEETSQKETSQKETLQEETVSAPLEDVPEKPRFIENPLPLPKKHEKRTMDYQYDVSEAQMKFDFEVNENDDFDIT